MPCNKILRQIFEHLDFQYKNYSNAFCKRTPDFSAAVFKMRPHSESQKYRVELMHGQPDKSELDVKV